MAATVEIHEMSALSTGVDKTGDTIRMKSADENTVDNNNRLQIPGSGSNYSYTKQLRAYVAVDPTTDLTNLEAYSDGNNGYGTGIGLQYDVQSSFQTQQNTDIAGTDIFTKTSGSPIDMDSGDTQFLNGEAPAYWGSLLRIQMSIASTASPGSLGEENITFSYDET